jgi:hypothetical protein
MGIEHHKVCSIIDEFEEVVDAATISSEKQSPFPNYELSRAIMAGYEQICEKASHIVRRTVSEVAAHEFLALVTVTLEENASRSEERKTVKAGAERGIRWMQSTYRIGV